MANAKISALTLKATAASADVLPILDSAAGNANKQTTVGGLNAAMTLAGLSDTVLSAILAGDEIQYDGTASKFKNRPAFFFRPKSKGAVGDARRYFGLTVTSGSAVVTAGSPVFPNPAGTAAEIAEAAGLVGKTVSLDYAGAADATLTTTVVSVNSTTQVTLGATAGQNKYGKCVMRYHGTDDTTAVQNAINAAVAVPNGLGGVLLDAVYSVTGNIDITDDLWMEGAGRWKTGFMLRNSSGAVHVLRTKNFDTWTLASGTTNANRAGKNFALHRFFIDGNGRNNSTARFGLALYAYDYDLKDLVIYNTKKVGLWCEANLSGSIPAGSGTGSSDPPYLYGTGPGGIHAYVERIMVFACNDGNTSTTIGYGYGAQVALFGPHDSYWQGFDIYQSGTACAYGLKIGHSGAGGNDGAGGGQFSDMHIWGNHTIGVDVASGGSLMDNVQSEGGTTQLRIAGSKIKVNHVRLYGVTGTFAAEGLDIATNASDWQATNVKVENCDTYAVRFGATGGANGVLTGSASSDNATPPPLVVLLGSTLPAGLEANFVGTAGYNKSLIVRGGHAVASTDWSANANWGATNGPTLAVGEGSTIYKGRLDVTTNAAPGTQTANPSVTLTFPKAFTRVPFIVCSRLQTNVVVSTGTWTIDSVSATSARFTLATTPGGATTYSLCWMVTE